ncbi:F-box protein CPR1, partial [Bienertia sinuspersici]
MAILPLHILIFEILPRLPTTTLLRFKSLNKFFYDFISSKEFINHHLHNSVSSNSNRPIILFINHQRRLYILDADSENSSLRYLQLPPPFSSTVKVVGCSRGLFCLSTNHSNIYDWIILNPCTGEVSNNISMSYSNQKPNFLYRGFGYDSLNDDYKLILVEYYYRNSDLFYSIIHYKRIRYNATRNIRVFSMKANSWRCIENNTEISIFEVRKPTNVKNSVLLDNCLMHWLFKYPYMGQMKSLSIGCFNLQNEQWGADVALPDLDEDEDDKIIRARLGIVDGCLCLLVDINDNTTVLWIMKEYGVKESWTKIFVEAPHHCFNRLKSGNRNFVWYNIRDKT